MSAASATTGRLRRGWEYYRRYTKRRTGVHAGATAALTVFGLLAYYERWFVVVAIVAYLLPPVYLYLTGDDLTDREYSSRNARDERRTPASTDDGSGQVVRNTNVLDADADGTDADADADSNDGDTDNGDTDSDDGDTDTDSDDSDTDSDSDSDG